MFVNVKQCQQIIVRMFSSYIHRKYTPNILVRLGQSSAGDENRVDVCHKLRNIVNECYGNDRFVVYSVNDDELNCDSRTWSAAGMIDFSAKTFQNNLAIPKINLSPEVLNNEPALRKELFTFFNKHVEPFTMKNESQDPVFGEVKKPTEIIAFNSPDYLPKLSDASKNVFDYKQYCTELRTTGGFGRVVNFQEITSSTMDLIKQSLDVNGSLAICNYQLSGIGRNDNQWLSPEGCAMWTINLNFGATDPLFNRLSILQHVTSLAILQSIPFHRELELFIKWPNDILYRGTGSKLCGIITKCQFNQAVNIQIGIGLNLNNRHPSICLNELIDFYNDNNTNTKMFHFKRETLIANFMNNLQTLLSLIVDDKGLQRFKELYVQNWIHGDSIINVQDRRLPKVIERRAKIVSIDDFGFLMVIDTKTQESLSLQPDGNRFDLMNSLVVLNK